jgi:hypothetical protein
MHLALPVGGMVSQETNHPMWQQDTGWTAQPA